MQTRNASGDLANEYIPRSSKSPALGSDHRRRIAVLSEPNTPHIRAIRRRYTRQLAGIDPQIVLDVARELVQKHEQRGAAYELAANYRPAFARTLAGPAWLRGQISDA